MQQVVLNKYILQALTTETCTLNIVDFLDTSLPILKK